MKAIRSLNISTKEGETLTVPKDEVWKIWISNGSTSTSFSTRDFSQLKPVILGGVYA